MSDEPEDQGVRPPKGESRDAYLRRLARAMGFLMIFSAIALSVGWLTSPGPKSLGGLITIAGFTFAVGWSLLLYWRTGHDPSGYSKPLFGKRDAPDEPKDSSR